MPSRFSIRSDRSRMVGPLTVQLFGRFRVSWRGREVAVEGRPAQALLTLIVLRPRPWAREAINAEIWPDAGHGPSSRLRQALWRVRKSLSGAGVDPAEILEIDDDTIGLRRGIGADVDAARFEEFILRRPPALEAALPLYGGEFAETLGLECLAAHREYLADLYEDALASVARTRLAAGNLDGARRVALTLLERDPLREEAHAILIEVYGFGGTRSQVSRQYRRLRNLLASELEAEPLSETNVAYLAAMARTAARSADRAAMAGVRSGCPPAHKPN